MAVRDLNSDGFVDFKVTINNTDGSVSRGSITTSLSGSVTKDSWKTVKRSNKFSESWSEDKVKNKISVNQSIPGGTFSALGNNSFLSNTSTNAKVWVGTNLYTGTATYNPANGILTFTTTKPAKDGSTATYTFDTLAPSGVKQTLVTTLNGEDTTTTHTAPARPQNAMTPDGRLIMQDMPPAP